MNTRECRHCKLEIRADARRCPHCHGHQSWIADQRDPRWLALFFVFPLVALGTMFYFTFKVDSLTSPEPSSEKPRVTVQDSTFRLVSAPDGTHLYVLGHASNASGVAAAGVWFRVTVFGEGDAVLDNLLVESKAFSIEPKSTEPFRLTSLVAPLPSEVRRVDVTVADARQPSRWDLR